jgi:hypothetical protein
VLKRHGGDGRPSAGELNDEAEHGRLGVFAEV